MIRTQIIEGQRYEVEVELGELMQRRMPPPCTCCPDPQRRVHIEHLSFTGPYAQARHVETSNPPEMTTVSCYSALVVYEDGER